ncbi:transcription factor bHLH162-like [Papaver somniferum]|uniref:transcription factor bHLH162-like n=1 Tax=Papaver somniferum TaxID=3469 RepID=UPI000E6FC6F9|nr:transcription factor bHLH162-like [Papaver somniferum]
MKSLYSQLNSLLIPPENSSKKLVSVPDQLHEATEYIENLQTIVERMKQKKQSLLVRPSTININNNVKRPPEADLIPPIIEINIFGYALKVLVIASRIYNQQSLFYEIIRVLQEEERAEIVNANFSIIDNVGMHTIHSQVGDSELGFGVERVRRRLTKLVHEFVIV